MTSRMDLSPQSVTIAIRRSISTGVGLLLLASSSALAVPQAAGAAKPEIQTAQSKQAQQPDNETRFDCQVVNGDYVVMYYPESQPGQAYPWATPSAMGGGWTPQLRCNEISRRLESYRPDGLQEMRTSTENGYNILCVTTERDSDCRIVLTVPPGQDPLTIRDRVFENLTVADSGQRTDAVNTFRQDDAGDILRQVGEALDIDLGSLSRRSQRSNSLNLRPFLDRADGGTGARLNRTASNSSSPSLNPNRFR